MKKKTLGPQKYDSYIFALLFFSSSSSLLLISNSSYHVYLSSYLCLSLFIYVSVHSLFISVSFLMFYLTRTTGNVRRIQNSKTIWELKPSIEIVLSSGPTFRGRPSHSLSTLTCSPILGRCTTDCLTFSKPKFTKSLVSHLL